MRDDNAVAALHNVHNVHGDFAYGPILILNGLMPGVFDKRVAANGDYGEFIRHE